MGVPSAEAAVGPKMKVLEEIILAAAAEARESLGIFLNVCAILHICYTVHIAFAKLST